MKVISASDFVVSRNLPAGISDSRDVAVAAADGTAGAAEGPSWAGELDEPRQESIAQGHTLAVAPKVHP